MILQPSSRRGRVRVCNHVTTVGLEVRLFLWSRSSKGEGGKKVVERPEPREVSRKVRVLDDRTKVRGDSSGSAMTLGPSGDAKTLRASWRCACVCDDPRAHCQGSGRCECIRDDSWAHASKRGGATVPHFKPSCPPAREYLTQYSAMRWESGERAPQTRAKLRTPWWRPRRWYALGATVCQSLREEPCCAGGS